MSKSEGTVHLITTDDVKYLIDAVENPRNPRGYKESALRRIREIEREQGITLYGNYNHKKG